MISNNLRTFYARGLHHILPASAATANAPVGVFANMNAARSFAKKSKKASKSDAEQTEQEEEPVVEAAIPEPVV